jgi:hypothetical protein
MNAFYDESPGLRVPEFIGLFANKNLKALTRHFLASPEQFACLLNFQRGQWRFITDTHKARYKEFLVPIVDKNFAQRPSAGQRSGFGIRRCQAAIIFSFVIGIASTKVCIGVFPKPRPQSSLACRETRRLLIARGHPGRLST